MVKIQPIIHNYFEEIPEELFPIKTILELVADDGRRKAFSTIEVPYDVFDDYQMASLANDLPIKFEKFLADTLICDQPFRQITEIDTLLSVVVINGYYHLIKMANLHEIKNNLICYYDPTTEDIKFKENNKIGTVYAVVATNCESLIKDCSKDGTGTILFLIDDATVNKLKVTGANTVLCTFRKNNEHILKVKQLENIKNLGDYRPLLRGISTHGINIRGAWKNKQ